MEHDTSLSGFIGSFTGMLGTHRRRTLWVSQRGVKSLAVSSAVFLILELDRPCHGTLQLSSARLRNALALLGH